MNYFEKLDFLQVVAECTMDRPWALLVWGIVTFILYTFVVIAGLDR